MIRLLIGGAGSIGRRHLAHARQSPRLALVGVVDPDPAARPADLPGFAALEAVDRAADAILIATPTATHAALAEAALERGWHVLVEKPLAGTLAEADRIVAAARRSGRQVLVGHHRRHHPRVAALQALLASGRIGRPVAASLIWALGKPARYFDPPWRSGMHGAPVLQNLVHEVDLLRHLLGEITHVSGIGANAVRGAARTESGAVALGFEGGAAATIAFADCAASPWGFEAGTSENPEIAPTGQDCLWIACTEGAVAFPSLTLWSGATDWATAPAVETLAVPDRTPPLQRQLEHFADMVEGRCRPVTDAEDGRRTLEATLAIEAATRPHGVDLAVGAPEGPDRS